MASKYTYRPGSGPGNGGRGSNQTGHASGMPPGSDPKKWSARFPSYQIDFTAVASGKRIAATKKRVRWRFGFSNSDALEAGETGTSCRGEEHDVTIVWSVTSGKRLILADGQEVHYSTNRSSVLEYSWSMRGNHVLKVIAHAAPAVSPTPGFRQYDLYIDGQSFFNMPKVYELGLRGPIPSHDRVPGVIDRAESSQPSRAPPVAGQYYDPQKGRYVGPEAPRNPEEEEEDLQRAISASIEESRKHLQQNKHPAEEKKGAPSRPQTTAPAQSAPLPALPPVPAYAPAPAYSAGPPADLLDFGLEPSSPALALPPAAPAMVQQGALVVAQPDLSDPFGVPAYAQSQPPAAQYAPQYAQPGPASYASAPVDYSQPGPPSYAPAPVDYSQPPPADPYAPQLISNDPFAPKPAAPPTFDDIHNSILGQYGASDAGSAAGSAPFSPSNSSAVVDSSATGSFPMPIQPTPQDAVLPSSQSNWNQPISQFEQLSINTNIEEEPTRPNDIMGNAMKSLVNIDDISSPVDSISMNPFAEGREKDEKEKKKRERMKRSQGIPPPSAKFGMTVSLADIQANKSAGDRKPVMQPNAFDPNAANTGALVVHGAQNGNYSVPPLAAQSQGFGVGASMAGGGFVADAPGGYVAAAPAPAYPQQQQGYGAPPMQPQGGYETAPLQTQHQQQYPPPQQNAHGNYGY